MDSIARKQLTLISEAINRHRKNSKEKSLIEENTVLTYETKSGEKAGVYINKDTLINIIKKNRNIEIRIVEVTNKNSFTALIQY